MTLNVGKDIYQKYSPVEIKAISMFIGAENEGHVKDLCPSSYVHEKKRQEFYDLMSAFVALDPDALDGVDFEEINSELQDGTLLQPMAHQAQEAVRAFINGYEI